MKVIVLFNAKIDEFLEPRTHCLSDFPLQTKQHFVLHCPALMEELGPTKHLQIIRLECQHKGMKNNTKHCQNLENCSSLAETFHTTLYK